MNITCSCFCWVCLAQMLVTSVEDVELLFQTVCTKCFPAFSVTGSNRPQGLTQTGEIFIVLWVRSLLLLHMFPFPWSPPFPSINLLHTNITPTLYPNITPTPYPKITPTPYPTLLRQHNPNPLSQHNSNPLPQHIPNPLCQHNPNPLSQHNPNPLTQHNPNPLSLTPPFTTT